MVKRVKRPKKQKLEKKYVFLRRKEFSRKDRYRYLLVLFVEKVFLNFMFKRI